MKIIVFFLTPILIFSQNLVSNPFLDSTGIDLSTSGNTPFSTNINSGIRFPGWSSLNYTVDVNLMPVSYIHKESNSFLITNLTKPGFFRNPLPYHGSGYFLSIYKFDSLTAFTSWSDGRAVFSSGVRNELKSKLVVYF